MPTRPPATPAQGKRDTRLGYGLALGGLLLVALALRLPALLALPLFNDEAVYLLRAERFPAMLAAPGVAGATLPDGKLLHELALALLARFPGVPLVPARLLSVACGLGTSLLLAAIGRSLGWPGAGLLAGLLFALSPLALLHDLLALPDAMLTLAATAVLWASLRYSLRPAGRREALGLGALLAVASLVKLSGLLLFALPALAALALPARKAERLGRLALLRLTLIVALATLAALAPLHYGGAERMKLGGSEPRAAVIMRNGTAVSDWVTRYLPGPLVVPPLIILGAAVVGRRRTTGGLITPEAARVISYLLAAGLAVVALFTLVGTAVYSRYILPAWPPLMLASALACTALWRRGAAWRGLAACTIVAAAFWGLGFAWRLATAPATAPMAEHDRGQYLERWSAGHNLDRLLGDLRVDAAQSGGLTIANHSQPRLVNLALWLYLTDDPRIRLVEVDLADPRAGQQLQALARSGPVVLVVDEQVAQSYATEGRILGLRLARSYTHPAGTMRFLVYTVRPQE